jgi:hypothetical protein
MYDLSHFKEDREMKIAVTLALPQVSMALGVVLKAFGHVVEEHAEEADLVIASDPATLLAHLKRGKQVIQFICGSHDVVATGLASSPEFGERFRVYQVVGWLPDIPVAEEMYAYLQSLSKEGM